MTSTAITLEEVSLRVRELLAELLDVDVETIGVDDSIFEADDSDGLGLDSLDVLKLALALAEEFDFDEPPEVDWETATTVDAASALVYQIVSGRQPQFT